MTVSDDGGTKVSGRTEGAGVVKVHSSRVGDSLRTARERLGWSREELAYHSGVSWSAIAQIESGRRKDVRLRSLSALAAALDVTVDYLIGARSTLAPQHLEHRVLPYESHGEFLEATIPFLLEGIERSHCLLAVTHDEQIELLRDTLGDRSGDVEFADSADWYRSPSAAVNRYRAFVTEKFNAGAPWIRVIGEPVWEGRSDAEITAWTRYESLINVAFASSPATIVCPYNTATLSKELVEDAHRTHPEVAHGGGTTRSADYRSPEDFLLEPDNRPGPADPHISEL